MINFREKGVSLHGQRLETVEQPGELSGVTSQHFGLAGRPANHVALQAFLPLTKAIAIRVEQLDDGPTSVAKSGQVAGDQIERSWTMTRKREVVLRIFRGESLDSLSRELGGEIYRLEKWRDAALGGIDVALKGRTEEPLKAEYDSAMKRVGELTMGNELLWQRVRRPGPSAKRRSKK